MNFGRGQYGFRGQGRGSGGNGRGNFRGPRGGQNGFKIQTPYRNERAPAVVTDVKKEEKPQTKGPPVPMHLSKVASTEKNDPLYKEAVFPSASEEMRPIASTIVYAPGCEGMTEVIRQTHEALKSKCPGWSKKVPLEAFEYYCAAVVYSRLLTIHSRNNFDTDFKEQRFSEMVENGNYLLPAPLSDYLQGFGNTMMPSGREVLFKLLDRQYHESEEYFNGWFGQISPDNHYLYRMYPCLPVYLLRIKYCMDYTDGILNDNRWQLPNDIRPEDEDAGYPTENLLGYSLLKRFSNEQIQFLRDQGINNQVPIPLSNVDIPYCSNLMNAVQRELEATQVLKMLPVQYVVEGSQGQNLIVETTREQPAYTSPNNAFILSKINSNVAYLASAFKYRMRYKFKRINRDFASLNASVYDFNDYVVPIDYALSVNVPRDHEDPIYNKSEFQGIEFIAGNRIKELIRSELV